jgi:hypothetical protein
MIRKAIINAKRAIASTSAKAKIEYENSCDLTEGFREVPIIKAANTAPIPIPGPARARVAIPAPRSLKEDNNIMRINKN